MILEDAILHLIMIKSHTPYYYCHNNCLFHYTSDTAKRKIVNEKENTAVFRLSKASSFYDKNEGTFILEPFYHACGWLYNKGLIDKHFFELLMSIKAKDIISGLPSDDPWILCFTADGCSQHMKERYAPRDGWIIGVQANAVEEFTIPSDLNKALPDYMYMAEVKYSYDDMKEQIQEDILFLFKAYESDETISVAEKDAKILKQVPRYLLRNNFCYKSESYKAENEIRLICYIKKPSIIWKKHKFSEESVCFAKGKNGKEYLYIKFSSPAYVMATQKLDMWNCLELNANRLSNVDIQNAVHKYSSESNPNSQ